MYFMNPLLQIPELQSLQSPSAMVRIPQEIDVPMTDRVLRLIDSAPFRRLSRISQLGLVATVYPGATHSRFEHSLGVYRNALLYLQRLATIPDFQQQVSVNDAQLFLVSALFHDVGHFPFCHLIEDMQIPGMQRHEAMASIFLESDSIAKRLEEDWAIQARDVCELLSPRDKQRPRYPLLSSLLSGPVDVAAVSAKIAATPSSAGPGGGASALEARVSALENELAVLRERLEALAGAASGD